MLNITKKQALNRWDKLPMILREAIFSERNADILWSVCEDQHLPENKIYKVASLVGDVLMGLTHPDDLTKEIKEALALNPIIIDSIVKEVNIKIFALIRSEINKALSLPMPTEEEIEVEEAVGKIEKAEGPIVSDIIKGEVRYTKPEGIEAEPMKIIPTNEGKKVMIPGAQIDTKISPRELALSPRDSALGEGPVIIQKEEEFKPVMGSKKSLGELFGFLRGSSSSKEIKKEAPVAVKIEIGRKDIPLKEILELKPEINFPLDLLHIKSPMIIKSTEDKEILLPQNTIETPTIIKPIEKTEPRVVHYSDLKTPLPETKPPITYDLRPITNDLRPMNNNKSIIEPIKEISKEKVKVVDFTAEAIIPKKNGIIQDVAPKAEITIGNIDIPKPPIIEKKQDKIEQSFIERENQKNKQEEPKKKKGFFGFLFRKKEIIANNADIKINEKSVAEKENKQAANINVDEQVIKLIKEQVETKK